MVVVHRDFPALVARAEQIIIGTVSEVREGPDASGAPATFVTFSDVTVLKGDVGATLTVQLYGGTSGAHIPDMPRFSVGEQDILFVAGNGRAVCPLVGVWQGRFYVRTDPASGIEVVEDSDHQPVLGLTGTELKRAPLGRSAAASAPMSLATFQQLILDELAQPRATPSAPTP